MTYNERVLLLTLQNDVTCPIEKMAPTSTYMVILVLVTGDYMLL